MIVTPSYSREVGEGARLVGGRVPSLGLPDPPSPAYKPEVGGGVFKGGLGPAFDHNKNTVSDKEGGPGGGLGPLPLGHHLQPFTAPWLAEVAHITPAPRPDHLPFPQAPAPPLPDYYPHFPSLPHRPPGYYPHPFLAPASSSHFLRDFQRHAHRPYPPLDPRPPIERPTPVSGAPTLVRPLGPPSLRGLHPDPRDLRESPSAKLRQRPPDLTLPVSPSGPPGEPSPRGPHGEPSPKRRAGSGAFPMPAPRSPRAAPRALSGPSTPAPGPGPPVSSPAGPATTGTAASISPTTATATATATTSAAPANATAGSAAPPLLTQTPSVDSIANPDPPPSESRPSSPYHAHFARGALVRVGAGVRRVEELETRDFLEAASVADDLMLHPSTVAAITPAPGRPSTSTITFTFSSSNTQVSVEAAVDHPFFVFHSGWSSCNPERTQQKYDLKVRLLQVGDVCVSLTKKVPGAEPLYPPPPPPTAPQETPEESTQTTPTHTAPAPNPSSTSSSQPTAPLSTSFSAGEEEPSPSGSGGVDAAVWGQPEAASVSAASRTSSGRQHSSDEAAQHEEKDGGRKRRWSDPGQTT